MGHIGVNGSVHVASSSKAHCNTYFASSHKQKDTLQLKACQGTLQGKTRSGVAVSEPEPPAGGFLWDLMDHLWFTGAPPPPPSIPPAAPLGHSRCTHLMQLLLSRKAVGACMPLVCQLHSVLPNRCCLVGVWVWML